MKKLRVAFVCNMRRKENEFEVEYDPPDTIEKVKRGIEYAGHEFLFIEADEKAYENLKRLRPDLVFNRAEGIRGESRESQIPAFLEMLGIPYVGSNVLTTAIGLDKAVTKMFLSFHGVNTPRFQTFEKEDEPLNLNLSFPIILKPDREGSSMGIDADSVVHDEASLRRKLTKMLQTYNEPILAEEFIEGREFSAGILGNENPRVLPILEIDFSRFPKEVGTVYGQKAKTVFDSSANYVCPAHISEKERKKIEEVARKTFKVLGCRDFARIDMRMNSSGELFVLEVNPLPGIDYNTERDELSFYPIMAKAAGMDFNEMIKQILDAAIERYGLCK